MLTPLPMAYRTPYPWNVDPYTWYFDLSTHGIANPLPMVCRPPINDILTPMHSMLTPHPWYIEPPTHGISTPHSWYFDPSIQEMFTSIIGMSTPYS